MGVLRTSALRLNVGEAEQANDRPQPLHFLPARFGPRHIFSPSFSVAHATVSAYAAQKRVFPHGNSATAAIGQTPQQLCPTVATCRELFCSCCC